VYRLFLEGGQGNPTEETTVSKKRHPGNIPPHDRIRRKLCLDIAEALEHYFGIYSRTLGRREWDVDKAARVIDGSLPLTTPEAQEQSDLMDDETDICPGCRTLLILRWHTAKNGVRHVQKYCRVCQHGSRFVFQSPDATAEADVNYRHSYP
jgi:hypothetical protein